MSLRPLAVPLLALVATAASAQTRAAPNVGRLNQPPAYNKTLQVRVFGVESRFGRIAVQLCSESFYPRNCTLYAARDNANHLVEVSEPSLNETTVNIRVPRPGRYALVVWHDVNGNRALDAGEAVAYGNGAQGGGSRTEPPAFDAAAVEVAIPPVQTDVTLRYGVR